MNPAPPTPAAFEQAKAEFMAGLASQQAQQFLQAERHYQASLRLLPGRPSTLVNLAATQLRLGQPAAALASAEAALQAEPDSADALLHRGSALAQQGRVDEALASFERLTNLAPDHPLAWSHLGNLLRTLDRTNEAVAAFREALHHGADPELHRYYLAALAAVDAPRAPPRHYVQGLFDSYAADFDEHLVGKLGYRAHIELVARLLRSAQAAKGAGKADSTLAVSALDLGCGTGLCGPLLRPLTRQLTGLDLSAAMLARSRDRGVYDRLVQADAVDYLASIEERFDLIVAADVLIYVGDPAPLFEAAARAMTQGWFAFSVECCDDDASAPGWQLLPSLRYAHSRRHLLQLAHRHGFEPIIVERAPVRTDQLAPVEGLYLVLKRQAPERLPCAADTR